MEELLFGQEEDQFNSSSDKTTLPPLRYDNTSSSEDEDYNSKDDYDSLHEEAHVISTHITHDSGKNYAFIHCRKIDPNWILLNTGSSIEVFSNPNLLEVIYKSRESNKIHCNAGVIRVKHKRMLPKYGEVWYNKKGVSNILSMPSVTQKFPIVYDSMEGENFIVQKPTEHLIFNRSWSGL